jgi:hypothetical protein
MAQWYGRVNWARLSSPAIQLFNQHYLDLSTQSVCYEDSLTSHFPNPFVQHLGASRDRYDRR